MKPEIQTFIPSHADPISSKEVRQTLEFIEDVQGKVTAMFEAGRTLAEVKKAFGVQEIRRKREPGFGRVWLHVYLELSEKKLN